MGETDLANKCLDFCQTLSSRGSAFKFSLTMGSTFSFSLDTNVLTSDIQVKYVPKKKPSPSTIRRNARRREMFLSKKRNPAPSSLQGLSSILVKCQFLKRSIFLMQSIIFI